MAIIATCGPCTRCCSLHAAMADATLASECSSFSTVFGRALHLPCPVLLMARSGAESASSSCRSRADEKSWPSHSGQCCGSLRDSNQERQRHCGSDPSSASSTTQTTLASGCLSRGTCRCSCLLPACRPRLPPTRERRLACQGTPAVHAIGGFRETCRDLTALSPAAVSYFSLVLLVLEVAPLSG